MKSALDVSLLIHGIEFTGIFSSRAFLPALLTAFTLRYGDNVPYLED